MRLRHALRFVCIFIPLQSIALQSGSGNITVTSPGMPDEVSSIRLVQFGAIANGTISGPQAITVTSSTAGVSMNMSPASAIIKVGATQQFSATVTGSANTTVVWTVNNVVNGTATVGTISNSGLYTAPAVAPNGAVAVKATSLADTQKYATALVTVTVQAAHDPKAFADPFPRARVSVLRTPCVESPQSSS